MLRITLTTLGLICLGATIASSVAEADRALITPAPVLQRRDFPSNFIGYVIWDNGSIEYRTCIYPYTYSSSEGRAGCIGKGYNIGLKCSSGWFIDVSSKSGSCDSYCVTDTIFYSTNDNNPLTNVICASQSTGLKFLRTEILGAPTSEGVTFVTSIIISTLLSTETGTPPTTGPIPGTSSAGPPPNPTNNAGIITGAVIGALVLVALVALGLFFLLRRRSRGSRDQTPGSFNDQNHQPVPVSLQPHMPAMSQSYVSPVGFQPTYQPGPGSGSPPPIYGNHKAMNFETQQTEYRPPDSTAEIDGISSPNRLNQPSRGGVSELGTS